MKRCAKCKQDKDVNDFNKNKSKSDGRTTECKLCVKQYNAKYREENKDYFQEYQTKYWKENSAELATQKKEYIANNKSAHLKRQHNWYVKNIDDIKIRISQYKKDHPEQYQIYGSKRRALKKTAISDKFVYQDIIDKYGNRCVYCGGAFTHIDHYVPLSKGGSHTLENVRPSCETCNLTKSNKLPEDFLKYKGNKDERM